jgi:hypothetical protein
LIATLKRTERGLMRFGFMIRKKKRYIAGSAVEYEGRISCLGGEKLRRGIRQTGNLLREFFSGWGRHSNKTETENYLNGWIDTKNREVRLRCGCASFESTALTLPCFSPNKLSIWAEEGVAESLAGAGNC